jgi:tRNA uridine 5-carboxymethylaminomethyl modification enzyme
MEQCDVIVVGAGHAGCEAALAAAGMGGKTLLLTMNLDTIALMSCNPAIGGLAKGQLVREVDALGGEMGHAIDATGIQFRRLNTKKGPAVRSNRAQADKQSYRLWMKARVEQKPGLTVRQAMVEALWVEHDKLCGVITQLGEKIPGKTVVLTTGTFLRGLIHVGLTHYPAGRAGEPPAEKLSNSLKDIGFNIGRLKTGTTPRLDSKTIDFAKCKVQHGDEPPMPFSFDTERITQSQVDCWVTRTNEATAEVIRGGLDRSPLYTGVIEGIGPRYCPSIEDKVVRFPDRSGHHVFLEPEGRDTQEIYPNGIPTSLPLDVQEALVHTIPGLENARIMRPGYAIEYDFVDPIQLKPSLETRAIPGLFHAGQLNGTSGYEEAAAQGLIAGINAMLLVRGEAPLILDRSQAYIGVMTDDLVTKGTSEPYRMFTSRAEYRLLLREDNADLRLREIGRKLGLVSEAQYKRFLKKKELIAREMDRLLQTLVPQGDEINRRLAELHSSEIEGSATLARLLKRPELSYEFIRSLDPGFDGVPADVGEEVETMLKYQGYIQREEAAARRFKRMEKERIPEDIDYARVPDLKTEVREKLKRTRPVSLGQALRIPGVTPAAVAVLQVYIRGMDRDGRG